MDEHDEAKIYHHRNTSVVKQERLLCPICYRVVWEKVKPDKHEATTEQRYYGAGTIMAYLSIQATPVHDRNKETEEKAQG